MKKKICFVNCSSNGSTGTIIKNLFNYCANDFNFCFVLGDKSFENFENNTLLIANTPTKYKIARTETYLFGNDGFLSASYVQRIKKFLEKQKPDLVHIHNVHRSFCNVNTIIDYCKKRNIKIIWTLHDEWILTGRCCYTRGCEKWISGCGGCKHKDYYPRGFFDNSRHFKKKKFSICEKCADSLTFVTPSNWLKNEVIESGLPNKVFTINNGINTKVFKPGLANKTIKDLAKDRFIIGGAALYFNALKGSDAFYTLSKKLDPKKYFFVLIGSDKKDIEVFSENFIILPRTSFGNEMANFYNSLNVFINPTKADNYPTTHLESIACGVPVITYKVGGAFEMIKEGINGFVVPLNDIDAIIKRIEDIMNDDEFDDRTKISQTSDFSLQTFCAKYKKLYDDVFKNN